VDSLSPPFLFYWFGKIS